MECSQMAEGTNKQRGKCCKDVSSLVKLAVGNVHKQVRHVGVGSVGTVSMDRLGWEPSSMAATVDNGNHVYYLY